MKKTISSLVQDRLIRIGSMFSLILIVVSCVSILILLYRLQPLVPLYNQAPWGFTRLASKQFLFLPLIIALVWTIVSLVAARIFHSTMPLVGRLLIMCSTLSTILACIFLLRTFQLII